MCRKTTTDGNDSCVPETAMLIRGQDKYIFLWDDEHRHEAKLMALRWACHPDLTFTMADFVSIRSLIGARSQE